MESNRTITVNLGHGTILGKGAKARRCSRGSRRQIASRSCSEVTPPAYCHPRRPRMESEMIRFVGPWGTRSFGELVARSESCCQDVEESAKHSADATNSQVGAFAAPNRGVLHIVPDALLCASCARVYDTRILVCTSGAPETAGSCRNWFTKSRKRQRPWSAHKPGRDGRGLAGSGRTCVRFA